MDVPSVLYSCNDGGCLSLKARSKN
jgi:hypothetical protein